MRCIKSRWFILIASSTLLILPLFNPITLSISHASSKTTLLAQRASVSTSLYNNITLPKPPWWNGDQCDSTYYNNSPSNPTHQPAVPLGTTKYRGEIACGPMPFNFNPPLDVPVNFYTGAPTENEWECTELVKRYLYQAFGAPDLGNTFGKDVVSNYTNPTNNTLFQEFPNNNPPTMTVAPVPGDVLSFAATQKNPSGHTALVYAAKVDRNGNGTLSILEQNNTHDAQGTGTLYVGNPNGKDPGNQAWYIDTEQGYLGVVTGWLHPYTLVASANDSSDTNVLYAVDAMAAHSAKVTDWSTVWAVGHGGITVRQTLIEKWDGAHWSVIPNTPNLGNYDNVLRGLAVLSPTNIWAVGSYVDVNGGYHTLLLHYNGQSWTASTLGPGSLLAITRVSASEAWAVGESSTNPPTEFTFHLVNGKWTAVTDTSMDVVLHAVSASSATNVWAVGVTDDYPKTVTLHWTGGPTWTVVPSPNPGRTYSELYGVTAINANTVWAVGRSDSNPNDDGFAMEWTSQSGWGQPYNLPFTTGSILQSVTALSPTNVWAVGINDIYTLVEHYNGSGWTQIPSVDVGTDDLEGVMVNRVNGNVWAVGGAQQQLPEQTLTEFFN